MRRCGPTQSQWALNKNILSKHKGGCHCTQSGSVDLAEPSRKKQSTAAHMQVLQQQQWVANAIGCRSGRGSVLFVLGYRKRINVWFSSQLNRA